MKIRAMLLTGVIAVTACLTAPAARAESTEQRNSKFIHVSGSQILDEQENQFTIQGIAFGNNVWGGPTVPGSTHHTEASYAEIAALGFNSVRFYLNYQLFEDDSAPYQYKQSGFDWLNQNIAWAKRYNIKLILNMHIPQGGFQSQGNGTALWTDQSNQERLRALWKAIAERYCDEPVILGYGLINEPIMPLTGTIQQSQAIYVSYIKSLVRAIRTVDKNHILFVECLLALKNLETGKLFNNAPGDNSHFFISDDNIVYEFHDYSPFFFTHQDTDWAGTAGKQKYYPSAELIRFTSDYAWLGCKAANKTTTAQNGWVYYESEPVTKTEAYNIGKITCQVFDSGRSGTAYFDKIKVTEYDETGKATDIIQVSPNDKEEFWYWARDNSGRFGRSDTIGFGNSGSLYIQGTTDDANFGGKYFALKDGCSYVISAWVKRDNCKANAITTPRIDYVSGADMQAFDKAYLEQNLQKHIQFGKDHNIPVYLGEFGVVSVAFTQNRGAAQWVRDMIALCRKHDVHFNYHTYHEEAFGLYMNSDYALPDNRNTQLAALFEEILP